MNLNVMYQPENSEIKKNHHDVFVSFPYTMFEELKEEFKDSLGKYPEKNFKQMEFIGDEIDEDEIAGQFMFDILLPYGDLKPSDVTL